MTLTHVAPSGAQFNKSPRRGFLAFIGGLALAGTAVKVQADIKPTLILPERPTLMAGSVVPGAFPLLAAEHSQAHAFLAIKGNVPDREFRAWLEFGLHMVPADQRGRA